MILFQDSFENVTQPLDLFPTDESRWTNYQLEPRDSRLNRIDIVRSVHTGQAALRFQAQPTKNGVASKSDLVKGNFNFVKGDDVWSTVWYFLEGGNAPNHPVFIWDLEATKTGTTSPGFRLYLTGDDYLTFGLGKWAEKVVFRQNFSHALQFPTDQWVEVRVHMTLDEQFGLAEVWQNDERIIVGEGQTLPTAESVYDRLQVGITATSDPRRIQALLVDDVLVASARP